MCIRDRVDSSYDELIQIFQEDKFTRLPVYEDTTDNVIGILNMKDLLLCHDKDHFSVRDIMREPYFTYEHKNTAELFMEMRKSSISLAIVLDEYGATAGPVSYTHLDVYKRQLFLLRALLRNLLQLFSAPGDGIFHHLHRI